MKEGGEREKATGLRGICTFTRLSYARAYFRSIAIDASLKWILAPFNAALNIKAREPDFTFNRSSMTAAYLTPIQTEPPLLTVQR